MEGVLHYFKKEPGQKMIISTRRRMQETSFNVQYKYGKTYWHTYTASWDGEEVKAHWSSIVHVYKGFPARKEASLNAACSKSETWKSIINSSSCIDLLRQRRVLDHAGESTTQ